MNPEIRVLCKTTQRADACMIKELSFLFLLQSPQLIHYPNEEENYLLTGLKPQDSSEPAFSGSRVGGSALCPKQNGKLADIQVF